MYLLLGHLCWLPSQVRTIAARQKALYHDQLGTVVEVLKNKVRVQLDSTEEKDFDMKNVVAAVPAQPKAKPEAEPSLPQPKEGLGDILNLKEDD